jgi:hypothetical protein
METNLIVVVNALEMGQHVSQELPTTQRNIRNGVSCHHCVLVVGYLCQKLVVVTVCSYMSIFIPRSSYAVDIFSFIVGIDNADTMITLKKGYSNVHAKMNGANWNLIGK